MADQHIGYPGSVNAAQLAQWMPNVAAAQYSVEGLSDAEVVPNAIGSRGVTVKPGTVIGDGIMDVFESNTNLNLGSVASGSPDRWDMIVLRRTWSATVGSSTSIYTVIPGGPNRSLPSRNNNKGVLSDQPIALCRVKAGSSVVQEVVDLRCWASNGGVVAVDELVMNYLDQIGTSVTIGNKHWVRTVTAGGSASWNTLTTKGTIDLGGVGSSLTGGVNVFKDFIVQAGTIVQTSDGAGFGRITWPTPFPGGLLYVSAFNGDDYAIGSGGLVVASSGQPVHGKSGAGSKTDWVYVLHGYATGANDGPLIRKKNTLHRLNYLAIGW